MERRAKHAKSPTMLSAARRIIAAGRRAKHAKPPERQRGATPRPA